MISGCQGDFKGALRRVTAGEDSYFKIKKGDIGKRIKSYEKMIQF